MPEVNESLPSRLYRLLRQHPDWTDDQVASALSIRDTELADAHQELAELGLVRRTSREARAVVEPIHAVEQVLSASARALAEWTTSAQQLTARMDTFAGLSPVLLAAVDDAELHTTLEGNQAAREFLAELGGTVQHELLTAHTGGALAPEAIDAALPQDLAVLGRGIEVRTIFQTTATRSLTTLSYLEQVADAGAKVRIRNTLPFRMVLADGNTAVCSMQWAEGRSGAVVIRGAALVQLLRRIFEFCWAEAAPLDTVVGRPTTADSDLDAEQLLMLRLLADGLTDQAIGRQLGVAPRTFTRKLRQLFSELGIESRFQAGVEAARRELV